MEAKVIIQGHDNEKVKKIESYRWVVWTILAAVYIFVTFHRMSAGVVRNDLQQAFSIGAAQFANIGSMYFYAYFNM
jgi:sugar phosphate permease